MSYQDPAAGGRQPTEEELRAAMEEQMRRIRVQDVLLQTAATLVNLGGRRLGLAPDAGDERDLEQARLAIEGVRALAPLLGAEEASAVREALSQLQVAYAREAQQPAGRGRRPSRTRTGGRRGASTGPGARSWSEGAPVGIRAAGRGRAGQGALEDLDARAALSPRGRGGRRSATPPTTSIHCAPFCPGQCRTTVPRTLRRDPGEHCALSA